MAEVLFCYGDLVSALLDHQPLRRALRRTRQEEFTIGLFAAEVLQVRAGQTTAANKSVARRARPAAFNRQCPHAAAQGHLVSYHGCVTEHKTMFLLRLNLN